MNQQPDKLFRDKLQGYQRPVPAMVWKRIAEERMLKTRKVLLLKAAASFLLLATGAILIFPFLHHQSSPLVKNKQESFPATIESQPGVQPEKKAKRSMKKEKSEETDEQVSPASVSEKPPSERPSSPKPAMTQEDLQTSTPVISSPELDPASLPDITAQVTSPPSPADAEIAPRKTVTIVFTAEEVNAKYFSAQATSDVKESSRLQNLLDKAQDLKHNQDPLGEIRQKKNEILAMNFRKEKPTTQND